jgi:hypothetical protein
MLKPFEPGAEVVVAALEGDPPDIVLRSIFPLAHHPVIQRILAAP